ncbi:MAG TPA: acetyl-CoA carboxylase biotin carboxylase subunit, partial [Methanothrix sp.]|nr:acetyl-CoA carboxylase biotin carboxylase subunit [Methanothrix sp.]
QTNINFHLAVLRHERFRRGDINTNFLKEEAIMEEVKKVAEAEREKGLSLASALGADTRKVAAISAAVGAYMAQREPASEE